MKHLLDNGADVSGMVSVSQIQTFLSCKHKCRTASGKPKKKNNVARAVGDGVGVVLYLSGTCNAIQQEVKQSCSVK